MSSSSPKLGKIVVRESVKNLVKSKKMKILFVLAGGTKNEDS